MMDQETARYLRIYYSNLFTPLEREALNHAIYSAKINAYGKDVWEKIYLEKGWISDNPKVLALLADGFEAFERNAAKRMLMDHGERIYLNRCRKCVGLARTPRAKQCRHCGHQWHGLTAATLMFKDVFIITGRGPVIVTDFVDDGIFQVGQFANLTPLGLNKHVQIKGVEFALIRSNGLAKDLPSLMLPDLREEDVAWLKEAKPEGKPFEVLREGWLF